MDRWRTSAKRVVDLNLHNPTPVLPRTDLSTEWCAAWVRDASEMEVCQHKAEFASWLAGDLTNQSAIWRSWYLAHALSSQPTKSARRGASLS